MDWISKGLNASRETKSVEFKEAFDVSSSGEWCEILKDIIAIANSDGGVIFVGLDNTGLPTDFDVKPLLNYDSADIANKIAKYTGYDFSGFDVEACIKNGKNIAAIVIEQAITPIAFTSPGNYVAEGGRQKTAFSSGTVYFRHGAKSAPGTTEDIRKAIDKRIEALRKDWARGLKKVVEAPQGSQIVVVPPSTNAALPPIFNGFRIVSDPQAPAVTIREEDIFANFPYTYRTLSDAARERYSNFVENQTYHDARKRYESDTRCSVLRLLNPSSPKSARTRFYSPMMLEELDKHYKRTKG